MSEAACTDSPCLVGLTRKHDLFWCVWTEAGGGGLLAWGSSLLCALVYCVIGVFPCMHCMWCAVVHEQLCAVIKVGSRH